MANNGQPTGPTTQDPNYIDIADTTPPEASLDRVRRIGERLADHEIPSQET